MLAVLAAPIGYSTSLDGNNLAQGIGFCRTPEGTSGVYQLHTDKPPLECAEFCLKDPLCKGFETRPSGHYTQWQVEYLKSFMGEAFMMSAAADKYHCEIHIKSLGYAQTGTLVGSWDVGTAHTCGVKTAYSPPYLGHTFFSAAGGEAYAVASGACRTEAGGSGTYTGYFEITPQECKEKCDEDETCIGFETSPYTAKEKESILRAGLEGGLATPEGIKTCELHTAPLAYAQNVGVFLTPGTDYAGSFGCFVKGDASVAPHLIPASE